MCTKSTKLSISDFTNIERKENRARESGHRPSDVAMAVELHLKIHLFVLATHSTSLDDEFPKRKISNHPKIWEFCCRLS